MQQSVIRAAADSPATRRLQSLAPLSAREIALLEAIQGGCETFERGQEISPEGAPGRRARLLADGWACRLRALADGRRQIIRLLLPGDIIGLSAEPGPLDRCAAVALTRTRWLNAAALKTAITREPERWPGLVTALGRAARAEEGQLLDQITRLGHQTACERMAHLLLELHERLTFAGLTSGASFALPLNQETLADTLGLSLVHINRTLQQMRRAHLIQMRGGRVVLLDRGRLREIADRHGGATHGCC